MEELEEVVCIQRYQRELNPDTPAFYAAESIDRLFRDVQEAQAKYGVSFPEWFSEDPFLLGFVASMAREYLDMHGHPDVDFEDVAETFLHLQDSEWKMNLDAVSRFRSSNDVSFARSLENGKKYAVTEGGFSLFEDDPAVAKARQLAEAKVSETERLYNPGLYEQYLSMALYNELFERVVHEIHPKRSQNR